MINGESISILGTGSWANTLAFLLGQSYPIILWGHDEQKIRRIAKTRRFKKPATLKYPDNVKITAELRQVFFSRIIINAISLKGMEETYQKISLMDIDSSHIFVNGSKGIDSNNLQTPLEIISKFLPNNPRAVISGPNLALELIQAKPMVTEVASADIEIAKIVQAKLSNPSLRIYINNDVKGVELCGALKNIIAIAAGASDALELGESTKASLMCRGLHEMGRFLEFYGCKSSTLMGPAGIGDLVATCSSALSRNYRVGYYLSKGKTKEEIIKKLGEVAEGINTTYAVQQIAQDKNIDMPIVEQIKRLLDGEIDAVTAVLSLMQRPNK
ncbi:MAG: NAD(P)-dependent glycerol-3-phosphate dehydrogenase [Cyanobacteria bacterium]|nr:NAD(P)-dependent glycerol-3-phosphate dehydrogenase [Cyanobacteriota bacterium]